MTHRRAKLTPFGRQILVQRIEGMGWVAARAAETLRVSRATAQKWLKRYREEGTDGLEDRTSRPRRCPRQLPAALTSRILEARVGLKLGPHRLSFELGCPRSTVYSVLRRHGLSRLHDSDRPSGVGLGVMRSWQDSALPQGGGGRCSTQMTLPDLAGIAGSRLAFITLFAGDIMRLRSAALKGEHRTVPR
jgi:hypothetical protein